MSRKYFYAILAFTFFCLFLILIFFIGNKPAKEISKNVSVDDSLFPKYISATGIVEPQSGNISISSPFNRMVEKINVLPNDQVKKGEILFQLEHQDFLANLKIKQKEYEKSLANLHKLEALPRKEDLMMAQDALNKAKAAFNESKAQYEMVVDLPHPKAISKEEQNKRLYGYQQAEAEFKQAQAQFEKVKGGAWEPELKIAHREVEQARADMEAFESEIERTAVKSPADGTILQLKIHEGEILDPSETAIILGNIDDLNLRVNIDQLNAAKFHPDSRAVAYRQGDPTMSFPLKFIHVERIMVPKKYLTNEIHEKVDTQVFEILYRIEKNDSYLFIGEKMDVYIDAEKK